MSKELVIQKPELFLKNSSIKIDEPLSVGGLARPDLIEYSMRMNSNFMPKESGIGDHSQMMSEVVQQPNSSK